MQFRYEMRELNDMLRTDCEAIARELLSDVKVRGNALIGYLPNGGKVSMVLHGAKRGLWKNWHAPDKQQTGGPINLAQWALFNGDRNRACIWARARLGLGSGADTESAEDRQRRAQQRAWAAAKRQRQEMREADSRVRLALDVYRSGRGNAEEAHDYIAHRLGLQSCPWHLPHLRFTPRLNARFNAENHAAMLSPVVSLASGKQVATHITLLQERGGRWCKARVDDAKRTLGLPRNAVIPLLAGNPGELLIAEGIENALAAAWLTPRNLTTTEDASPRVWAAGSAGFVPSLELPDDIASVLVGRDNDKPDSQVARMWREVEDTWRQQGRVVEYLRPPWSHKDFAAYLQAELTDA